MLMKFNIFFVLLFFLLNQSYADVSYEKLDEKDYAGRQYVTVTLDKNIEEDDFFQLQKVLNEININNYRLKEDSIYLNSGGGLIHTAKNMGDLIRKHHIATKINKDDKCISACIFLLAAGSCRMALGNVGIHRGRTESDFKNISEIKNYAKTRKADENYLKRMETSDALINDISSVPNWSIRYLSDLTKLKNGFFNTTESESYYWQEVVSRKIAAPKEFLLDNLYDRDWEIYDQITWYDKWVKKVDPAYSFPSCTEQMFLNQLEEYPNGTDKWDEQFELYDSWYGYSISYPDGEFDNFFTNEVPLKDGVSHFYTLDFFKKNAKEITYREVTTLSAPTEWESDEENLTISLDGRRAERTVTTPNIGRIVNGWQLDPKKDPTGPMKVEIYIDDELVKEFNYEIVNGTK
jgi:ATP-dependent protease ClpP protease subunit